MKLDCNFPELSDLRQRIGAPLVDWHPRANIIIPEAEYEITINKNNAPVVLKRIFDNPKKLATLNGKPAFIYIPVVKEEFLEKRKYHFMECSHIEEMKDEGRYEDYVATTRDTGEFDLTLISGWERHNVTLPLGVCRLCLKAINYKNYRRASHLERDRIYKEFDLKDFLSEHSTYFDELPKRWDVNLRDDAYPVNWNEISHIYRSLIKWECEQCGLNLSENRNLLHVHHVNGRKSDCRPENLIALCLLCHRELHPEVIKITPEDERILNELRSRN